MAARIGVGSCSRAGPKPKRSKSRRGSRLSCASSEGMPMHSVSPSIQQYSRGDNQWPSDIAAWREAGGSHISVATMGSNLTTMDGHIEASWRGVYNSVR
jgi:hypothetical protein